jgi:alpha-ketoglutarate-dependent taurine dioxygenase
MTGYLDALHRHLTFTPLAVDTVPGAPAPLLLTVKPGTGRLDPGTAGAIRAAFADRGVLLLRGFQPVDPTGVAAFTDQLFPGQPVVGTGEHPQADDTEAVYRPVPFAPDKTLLWHHENSFNADFPRTLIFICRTPAPQGGATTIVDSRLVYHQVPAEVRQRFAAGIRYTRRCDGYTSRSWQQLYGTDDPDTADRYAAANGEVLVIDGTAACITAHRPAFHPTAHGPSWINQLLHWHPAALPADLRNLIRRGTVPVFRDCTFGDGSPIADVVVDQVSAAHRRHEYPVAWQPGDVLLVDNTVFAHGRHPYRGTREHYVRMVGHVRHHQASQPVPHTQFHH